MNGTDVQETILERIFEGDIRDATAVLVIGPPRCGKTEFALRALLRGLEQGDGRAVLTVSNRVIADELGDQVIRRIGATTTARPVTTMSALAFRTIADTCARAGRTAPRLLNGAEQDALLRQVVGTHLRHVATGDICPTCRLLRDYFATDDWPQTIGADADEADTSGTGTSTLLGHGISAAFINQLRDMLARINELGADTVSEDTLIDIARRDMADAARVEQQWRLAFALRGEYLAAIDVEYPGEYRLDASQLMVEAVAALHDATNRSQPPALVIVDDVQDTTLAGLRLMTEFAAAGSRLILIGNPDESVQTFRGSYPEYVCRMVQEQPLGAVPIRLSMTEEGRNASETAEAGSYRELVAARVSLSIPSPERETVPLPERPGKLPAYRGAYPIAAVERYAAPREDDGLATFVYRSSREEMDDIIWRVKRMHLDCGTQWNDMAVIAHDNAMVRDIGERLRRDGVPVRYSSVTRPLKDEPFIQGLFALIELADLRLQGTDIEMSLSEIAAYTRSRVRTLMTSPLVTAGGRPARLEPVESTLDALASLSAIINDVKTGETDKHDYVRTSQACERLAAMVDAWEQLRTAVATVRQQRADDRVDVDDRLIDSTAVRGDEVPFGRDALYIMLALDDAQAPANAVLAAVETSLGAGNLQSQAFATLWSMVSTVADGMRTLPSHEPQYVLGLAWTAADVAERWQKTALFNTAEGRAANDRLDAAMRLFQYAQGTQSEDIWDFIRQMRAMQIEADSLARIRPLEQAVTLTTPAGSVGRHWAMVWIPAVQQDVWPNTAERTTLFGGEDLAEIMLRGGIRPLTGAGRDPRQIEVLSSEKKSLLVAMTRADRQLFVSAVWSDDVAPSDFLFGYMPERIPRNRDDVRFASVGQSVGQSVEQSVLAADDGDQPVYHGLDARPRDLVAAARVVLAQRGAASPAGHDAAAALALLAQHDVWSAHPDQWNFRVHGGHEVSDAEEPAVKDAEADAPRQSRDMVVRLSPSMVDRIWSCPVCWLLENRLSGPQVGNVAMGFGTLIHQVAQYGSEEHLDRIDFMPGAGTETRRDAIAERLTAIYEQLKPDVSALDDVKERYQALRKDQDAVGILNNIAWYFAAGVNDDYLKANRKNFSIGQMEDVSCEEPVAAYFDLSDILAAYNAMPEVDPIDRSELMAMMGALIGGWPEGMDERMTIRLSARIDRKETRRLSDGREAIRIVDYKTGRSPGAKAMFNDLQLVCYQLGLTFPQGGVRGIQALTRAPWIEQNSLFYVASDNVAAKFYGPEGASQPALFVDGRLNDHAFTVRSHAKTLSTFFDASAMLASRPDGVREQTWNQLVALRGTQAVWALTMIARVFYAGAVLRSTWLVAHPDSNHAKGCTNRLCPACQGKIDTVFETRKA